MIKSLFKSGRKFSRWTLGEDGGGVKLFHTKQQKGNYTIINHC